MTMLSTDTLIQLIKLRYHVTLSNQILKQNSIREMTFSLIYTLSLHDALPISSSMSRKPVARTRSARSSERTRFPLVAEEIGRAPSELQSRGHIVCRLLLEKKKTE